MDNVHYKFPQAVRTRNKIPRHDECKYNPDPVEFSFYQICGYPKEGFYNVRKIIYNEKLEPQDIYDKCYPKKKLEKFIEKTPQRKYQIYPTISIKLIGLPHPNQILGANSDLLK